MDALLLLLCITGIAALCVGHMLRNRQVHAEHWLWKKQRLTRARFLLHGGGAVSTLSALALFMS
ncbi:hypothetical protein [Nocardioides cavernaquae]|nr:hypothetical protein [Nocardioides cavernaquae]